MKNLALPLALVFAVLTPWSMAQDSDSLNLAGDQANSMNKLDDLMGRAQKRLEFILSNLGDLQAGNGAKKAYDEFKDNLEDIKDIRSDIKDRTEKVRELQGARLAAWTKEVSGMTDKDMRKLTNDQIDKAKADFDSLDKQIREVGGDANDLTTLLEDLKKYFDSSYSADSVKAAETMIDKARTSGREMQKSVDALRDTLYKNKKEVKGTAGQ
jgi:predicted  nucleic acid-binding Zn-ribbon protein